MRIRTGFVSNSSSTSFIFDAVSIGKIATKMLDIVMKDFCDFEEDSAGSVSEGYKAELNGWKERLKKAIGRKDVKSGKIGIVLPSINYETYLVQNEGQVYVSTSRNHDWGRLGDSASYCGGGYDDGDADKTNNIIESREYFDVCLGNIHGIDDSDPFDSPEEK